MGSAGPISAAAECTSRRSRTVLVSRIRARRASVSQFARACLHSALSLFPLPPSTFQEVASGFWLQACGLGRSRLCLCLCRAFAVRQALERECFPLPLVGLVWPSCTSAHSPPHSHSSLPLTNRKSHLCSI